MIPDQPPEPAGSPRVTIDDSTGKSKTRSDGGLTAVRTAAARLVRIVFGVSATILALGAVLVVLRDNINEQNSIVELITDTADALSGPFSRDDGVFSFTGKDAHSKNALLNWGVAAIVYLLVGRLLAKALTARTSR